jgi:hypothetical protein
MSGTEPRDPVAIITTQPTEPLKTKLYCERCKRVVWICPFDIGFRSCPGISQFYFYVQWHFFAPAEAQREQIHVELQRVRTHCGHLPMENCNSAIEFGSDAELKQFQAIRRPDAALAPKAYCTWIGRGQLRQSLFYQFGFSYDLFDYILLPLLVKNC